jgi:type IX secretion system PorP/SprF family membrane protein
MKVLSTLILIAFTLALKAQDPHFTQFNRSNIYLNPASVGTLKSWTVSHQYRNQWPKLSGDYITHNAAVQYGFNKALKGIGVYAVNDVAGSGAISMTRLAVPLAFGFKIKDLFQLNIGVEAAYQQKSIDLTMLTFGDMIDDSLGFVTPSNQIEPSTAVGILDFAAGMEIQVSKLKFGLSGRHLTQPNESFFDGESKLPFRLTTYANYDFSVGEILTITPSVLFHQQRDFQNVVVTTTTTYRFIKVMLGYRRNDAFLMGLGVKFKRLDVGYSYDLTTSSLSSATGGAHEFGIRFRFGKNKEGDFDNAF